MLCFPQQYICLLIAQEHNNKNPKALCDSQWWPKRRLSLFYRANCFINFAQESTDRGQVSWALKQSSPMLCIKPNIAYSFTFASICNDTIWDIWCLSTLDQVMTWCLMVPSCYLIKKMRILRVFSLHGLGNSWCMRAYADVLRRPENITISHGIADMGQWIR